MEIEFFKEDKLDPTKEHFILIELKGAHRLKGVDSVLWEDGLTICIK